MNLHLPLFNFENLFFLCFSPLLSSQYICQFCFLCFNPQLAPCSSFVFQFVVQLVLFWQMQFLVSFVCWVNSTVLYISWTVLTLLVGVYVSMYIHYFNYYLPDFVTAICAGFIFGLLIWIFVLISLNAIMNHLWNLHS